MDIEPGIWITSAYRLYDTDNPLKGTLNRPSMTQVVDATLKEYLVRLVRQHLIEPAVNTVTVIADDSSVNNL